MCKLYKLQVSLGALRHFVGDDELAQYYVDKSIIILSNNFEHSISDRGYKLLNHLCCGLTCPTSCPTSSELMKKLRICLVI